MADSIPTQQGSSSQEIGREAVNPIQIDSVSEMLNGAPRENPVQGQTTGDWKIKKSKKQKRKAKRSKQKEGPSECNELYCLIDNVEPRGASDQVGGDEVLHEGVSCDQQSIGDVDHVLSSCKDRNDVNNKQTTVTSMTQGNGHLLLASNTLLSAGTSWQTDAEVHSPHIHTDCIDGEPFVASTETNGEPTCGKNSFEMILSTNNKHADTLGADINDGLIRRAQCGVMGTNSAETQPPPTPPPPGELSSRHSKQWPDYTDSRVVDIRCVAVSTGNTGPLMPLVEYDAAVEDESTLATITTTTTSDNGNNNRSHCVEGRYSTQDADRDNRARKLSDANGRCDVIKTHSQLQQESVFNLAQQALLKRENSPSKIYEDSDTFAIEDVTNETAVSEHTPLLKSAPQSISTQRQEAYKRIRFANESFASLDLHYQHYYPQHHHYQSHHTAHLSSAADSFDSVASFQRVYSSDTLSQHHPHRHHSFRRSGSKHTQAHHSTLSAHRSEQCLALDCCAKDPQQLCTGCAHCHTCSVDEGGEHWNRPSSHRLRTHSPPVTSSSSLITTTAGAAISKAPSLQYNTFDHCTMASTGNTGAGANSSQNVPLCEMQPVFRRDSGIQSVRSDLTNIGPAVHTFDNSELRDHIYPLLGDDAQINSQNNLIGAQTRFSFGAEDNFYMKPKSVKSPYVSKQIDNYPTSPFNNSMSYCHESTDSFESNKIDSTSFYSVTLPKLKYVKVFLLASLIIYTLISFIFIREKEEKWTNVAVQDKVPAFVDLSHSLDLMFPVWKLRARGAFLPNEYANLTSYSVVFTIVQLLNDSRGGDRNGAYRVVKRPWAAPIAPSELGQYIDPKEVEHIFKLTRGDAYDHIHRYQLRIDTNSEDSIALTVNMAGFSELSADGIILAAAVLIFLYTLIIFEIVNRTLAAMLGATAAITCLTLIRDRPSLEKVVSWLDVETLCLLFGMMILVAILCETGFFDYLAVVAFRLAKGRTWPLIFTLCFFTGVLSAFLDNVTTILLMTPVTIRLCEIKNIDPKHVLISLVIVSNIGGASTPVGDPPNVIIISSYKIQQQGVDFGRFTFHMMPGIIISFIATLIYIRIYYRNLSYLEFEDSSSSEGETTEQTLKQFISNRLQTDPSSQSTPIPVSEHVTLQFGQEKESDSISKNEKRTSKQKLTRSSRVPDNVLDCSSDFDLYDSMQHHSMTNNSMAMLGNSSSNNRCMSCNNLEEFCAGTSFKDSIFDEKRVFRSSDELKREIEVWKRACNSISGYSRDENSVRQMLNRKVETLETILRQHCYETVPPEDNYQSVLAELTSKYKIRDRPLLIKSGVVMSLVISLFFMQSIPNLDLSLGWIAILGAILLLVLSDRHELESIIARVEWSTLIFFAALFVVMEALAELKFLWWIGRLTQDFINSVPEAQRLVVAILVFIWVSALASSFIDNIPLTTVMVKIIEDLADNNEFNIPLMPLIYALAFGACLGGNGTLIGASANVVCAGVAEQHGYRFTFMDFFRVGFPIMLITVFLSTIYLILSHVVFDWNF